jgi:peptidoglycan L-alanyl-D-glutamate endopeptidase CwlK
VSAQEGKTVPKVSRDLSLLAPKFRAAVERGVAACRAAGLDAFVYEAYRSNELQMLYYKRGRTVIPPKRPVTNAKTSLYSWHGFGLAVDVVSQTHFWEPPDKKWFEKVAAIFKQHECKWGGDWSSPDPPHFQWHLCKPSPSDMARLILQRDGLPAVWEAVGAD